MMVVDLRSKLACTAAPVVGKGCCCTQHLTDRCWPCTAYNATAGLPMDMSINDLAEQRPDLRLLLAQILLATSS